MCGSRALLCIGGLGCFSIFTGCDASSNLGKDTTRDRQAQGSQQQPDRGLIRSFLQSNPRSFSLEYSPITLWWDRIPESVGQNCVATGSVSNIAKSSYIGPDACANCHQENYQQWSEHPHRWMNALADDSTMLGDFSGQSSIQYLGGEGTFYMEGNQYRMRLERESVVRVYGISQTIGSRFFQYYIGKQIEGPEPAEHYFYREDHVLPFGYWLDYRQWVPIVHVSKQITCDSHTNDPYTAASTTRYIICNSCHTTFAMGDRLVRDLDILGRGSPFSLHVDMPKLLNSTRSELVHAHQHPSDFENGEVNSVFDTMSEMEAPEHAVTLGISCEACHFGLREHAEDKSKQVDFYPHDPSLLVDQKDAEEFRQKGVSNVNWSCSRCHVGPRPQLAAGMATWNSTEATDAFRGSCYSELTCVDCHDPHQAIGKQWSKTPEQDDASCLTCHSDYQSETALRAHTHHPVGSSGARCMNCHMPRINEGLQDVVRTHMIYSPTQRSMLKKNHPNACNLCHTDQSIDWTLQHLAEWYNLKLDPDSVASSADPRDHSAALDWLQSNSEAVRLIAADALTRSKNFQALPELIEALDDEFLLNRQFAYRGLEKMLDIDLETFGYRFYMTPEERKKPIAALRESLITTPPSSGTSSEH